MNTNLIIKRMKNHEPLEAIFELKEDSSEQMGIFQEKKDQEGIY